MMKKEYQRPAMKARRIDMDGALLAGSYIGKGDRGSGGWNGGAAKDFTFTDDEEEDESLKPYNPWE